MFLMMSSSNFGFSSRLCELIHFFFCFSPKDRIYYHRELLCHSPDKLRIDLVTVSSCHGISSETEPRFDHNLFPEKDVQRCRKFHGKRVRYFIFKCENGKNKQGWI